MFELIGAGYGVESAVLEVIDGDPEPEVAGTGLAQLDQNVFLPGGGEVRRGVGVFRGERDTFAGERFFRCGEGHIGGKLRQDGGSIAVKDRGLQVLEEELRVGYGFIRLAGGQEFEVLFDAFG